MGDRQAAQAVELVRALRHQLHEMTSQLARAERHGVGRNRRAYEMRLEAAALRRDIQKAEFLIDQLRRRYLNGDGKSGTRGSELSSSSADSGRW
jgi:hypothetical protein